MSEAIIVVEFDLCLAVAPRIKNFANEDETIHTTCSSAFQSLVSTSDSSFSAYPPRPGQGGFRCTSESKVNFVGRELAQE